MRSFSQVLAWNTTDSPGQPRPSVVTGPGGDRAGTGWGSVRNGSNQRTARPADRTLPRVPGGRVRLAANFATVRRSILRGFNSLLKRLMTNHLPRVVVAGAIWLVVGVGCRTAQPRPRDEAKQRVDEAVTALVRSQDIAGLTVVVMQDDRVVYEQAWGFSDLEARIPMEVGTAMQIGSKFGSPNDRRWWRSSSMTDSFDGWGCRCGGGDYFLVAPSGTSHTGGSGRGMARCLASQS